MFVVSVLFPHPKTECGCDKGGKLTCNLVQPICPAFCPPAEVDECPPGNPTQGAQEITCTKKLEDCLYGEARCCPEDDPVPNLSECLNRTVARVSFRITSPTQMLTARCFLPPINQNDSIECGCDAGETIECLPVFLICPAVLCTSQLLDSCPSVNPLENPGMFTNKFCNANFDGCVYGETECCRGTTATTGEFVFDGWRNS